MINIDLIIKYCTDFYNITDVDVQLCDNKGETIGRISHKNPIMAKLFCDAINDCSESNDCVNSHLYGSCEAKRFDGRYIFFCHKGLILLSAPLKFYDDNKTYSLIAGPILMTSRNEFLEELFSKNKYNEKDKKELEKLIEHIPVISPDKVHSMSEQLYVLATFISGLLITETKQNEANTNILREKSKLSEKQFDKFIFNTIIDANVSGKNYPIEKEDELVRVLSKGDIKGAKALLNEILNYVFFTSDSNFDIIKLRVKELVIIISRASVKAGADIERIFGLNFGYIKEIDEINDIEEIVFWLNDILNRFTEYIFAFASIKHIDAIFKATSYIKSNYMKKITLDEVAKEVFLSPSYFSKVFKEETSHNFNAYLNNIRIENSKKLLLDKNINMTDIAYIVGYEDQSYFSKVFKKLTGVSPLRYRQSMGKI